MNFHFHRYNAGIIDLPAFRAMHALLSKMRLNSARGARSVLGDSYLFGSLKPRQQKVVESFIHQRQYLAGEVIFDQGEEGQALYVILSGTVVICPQGRQAEPISTLEAGNFFGELALLDDAPRSAQAVAASPCSIAVLFRGDFERLMESHAEIASRIAVQLARYLGQRLRQMVSRYPAAVAEE